MICLQFYLTLVFLVFVTLYISNFSEVCAKQLSESCELGEWRKCWNTLYNNSIRTPKSAPRSARSFLASSYIFGILRDNKICGDYENRYAFVAYWKCFAGISSKCNPEVEYDISQFFDLDRLESALGVVCENRQSIMDLVRCMENVNPKESQLRGDHSPAINEISDFELCVDNTTISDPNFNDEGEKDDAYLSVWFCKTFSQVIDCFNTDNLICSSKDINIFTKVANSALPPVCDNNTGF